MRAEWMRVVGSHAVRSNGDQELKMHGVIMARE